MSDDSLSARICVVRQLHNINKNTG